MNPFSPNIGQFVLFCPRSLYVKLQSLKSTWKTCP